MAMHEEHLIKAFEILLENELQVNFNKSKVRKERIEYLGHWVSAEGVTMNEEKRFEGTCS